MQQNGRTKLVSLLILPFTTQNNEPNAWKRDGEPGHFVCLRLKMWNTTIDSIRRESVGAQGGSLTSKGNGCFNGICTFWWYFEAKLDDSWSCQVQYKLYGMWIWSDNYTQTFLRSSTCSSTTITGHWVVGCDYSQSQMNELLFYLYWNDATNFNKESKIVQFLYAGMKKNKRFIKMRRMQSYNTHLIKRLTSQYGCIFLLV